MQQHITRDDGERDLQTLQRSIQPILHPSTFVYGSLAADRLPLDVRPFCIVRESEGLTVVLADEDAARLGMSRSRQWRLITLTIHSSLEAVGLIALVSRVLAERNIACNVVSGYYHDHLLVPCDRADDAMAALADLAAAA